MAVVNLLSLINATSSVATAVGLREQTNRSLGEIILLEKVWISSEFSVAGREIDCLEVYVWSQDRQLRTVLA